jgi:hypothetical protein
MEATPQPAHARSQGRRRASVSGSLRLAVPPQSEPAAVVPRLGLGGPPRAARRARAGAPRCAEEAVGGSGAAGAICCGTVAQHVAPHFGGGGYSADAGAVGTRGADARYRRRGDNGFPDAEQRRSPALRARRARQAAEGGVRALRDWSAALRLDSLHCGWKGSRRSAGRQARKAERRRSGHLRPVFNELRRESRGRF